MSLKPTLFLIPALIFSLPVLAGSPLTRCEISNATSGRLGPQFLFSTDSNLAKVKSLSKTVEVSYSKEEGQSDILVEVRNPKTDASRAVHISSGASHVEIAFEGNALHVDCEPMTQEQAIIELFNSAGI